MAARSAYDPAAAHQRAQHRTRRPKRRKLEGNTQLAERVLQDLRWWWSPQQIAARLRVDFRTTPEMWVSHETIYTVAVRSGQWRPAEKSWPPACGQGGRASRGVNDAPAPAGRRCPMVVPSASAPLKPRTGPFPGTGRATWSSARVPNPRHWDPGGARAPATWCCFKPAQLQGGGSPRGDDRGGADAAPRALQDPCLGSAAPEMARHNAVRRSTPSVQVYFCDPRSPWQRGMNENTNGLLRQYFPKGSDFSLLTEEDLAEAAASLNNRPRQTLHWLKPAEALAELLALTG